MKPPVLWWVGPSTNPDNIVKHLEEYDFKQVSNMPGMAADLCSLNENIQLPKGLVIELADN